MDGHPCHGAVNKPTAMNTSLQRMYIDGSQRETSVRYAFIYTDLVNTHKHSRKYVETKCTNINMQYSVHHFSSESSVQSSDTYNRQEAVYTRLDLLYTVHVKHHHCMVHVRLSVLMHAVIYNLQTTSACMHHLPLQQRGEPPCTLDNILPLTLYLAH